MISSYNFYPSIINQTTQQRTEEIDYDQTQIGTITSNNYIDNNQYGELYQKNYEPNNQEDIAMYEFQENEQNLVFPELNEANQNPYLYGSEQNYLSENSNEINEISGHYQQYNNNYQNYEQLNNDFQIDNIINKNYNFNMEQNIKIELNEKQSINDSNNHNNNIIINSQNNSEMKKESETLKSIDPFDKINSTVSKNLNSRIIQNLSNSKSIENQKNQDNKLSQEINGIINQSEKINSPILISPLNYNEQNSSFFRERLNPQNNNHINSEKEEDDNIINDKEENEINENKINLIKEQEEIIFMSEDERKNEFDFKSHFELNLLKEQNDFIYKKVHKKALPLLSHFEMPENTVIKSPLISPNNKYIACIGKGEPDDIVYVWDLSYLNYYKYKFISSKVDSFTFTPDSKSIIIVYQDSNPIMYSLSNGKKILTFEKNGEEGIREGYQCSFTISGTHFALTSKESITLWSLINGKIRLKILDKSPIKIISREFLINIDNELNCVIRKIVNQNIVENFKIKGVDTPGEILDGRCTEDMENFIYVIKEGIIKYNFKDKEYTGLQKFECGVEKATLSSDGRYVLKTNLKNLCINDLKKEKNIVTITKEKFKDYKIDFNLEKLITIDNISITIQDYLDEKPIEKHIWLNKNPTKFEDIKFNKDYTILLGKVSPKEIVVYDLKTGYIIKKWYNIIEKNIDYKITENANNRIAIRTNPFLIKIWNFISLKEEASFYGCNTNSLCFNGEGNYIISGTKKGSEIARIWDISKQKYGSFRYNGSNDNINTVVHITSPMPKIIICCAVNQNPLIFNAYTKKLLCKCECSYKFKEIYEILSYLYNDIFIVKGKDLNDKNIGIMYQISNGSLLQKFVNFSTLLLANKEGYVVFKCDNINGGKLSSFDLKNKENRVYNEFLIQTDRCKLINDHKSVLIEYGDNINKEFNLINIKNGNFMGKINYTKKIRRNAEVFITGDKHKEELFVRYFEFLSSKDTLNYLKKKISLVEGKNEVVV